MWRTGILLGISIFICLGWLCLSQPVKLFSCHFVREEDRIGLREAVLKLTRNNFMSALVGKLLNIYEVFISKKNSQSDGNSMQQKIKKQTHITNRANQRMTATGAMTSQSVYSAVQKLKSARSLILQAAAQQWTVNTLTHVCAHTVSPNKKTSSEIHAAGCDALAASSPHPARWRANHRNSMQPEPQVCSVCVDTMRDAKLYVSVCTGLSKCCVCWLHLPSSALDSFQSPTSVHILHSVTEMLIIVVEIDLKTLSKFDGQQFLWLFVFFQLLSAFWRGSVTADKRDWSISVIIPFIYYSCLCSGFLSRMISADNDKFQLGHFVKEDFKWAV